jgi:hypothetical protein
MSQVKHKEVKWILQLSVSSKVLIWDPDSHNVFLETVVITIMLSCFATRISQTQFVFEFNFQGMTAILDFQGSTGLFPKDQGAPRSSRCLSCPYFKVTFPSNPSDTSTTGSQLIWTSNTLAFPISLLNRRDFKTEYPHFQLMSMF